MLKKHIEYYHGTTFPVRTMVQLYNPQKETSLTQDFTIIGGQIVFEWYRSLSNDKNGYGNGKCFTKQEHVKAFMETFEDLKSHSKDFDQLKL